MFVLVNSGWMENRNGIPDIAALEVCRYGGAVAIKGVSNSTGKTLRGGVRLDFNSARKLGKALLEITPDLTVVGRKGCMKPKRANRPTVQADVRCLHAGFRHKLFYEFREGNGVNALCRRHCLTRAMVEAVIREHITPNAESEALT